MAVARSATDALSAAIAALGVLPGGQETRAAERLIGLWERFRPGPAPELSVEVVAPIPGRLVRLDGLVVATLCPHHLVPARTEVTVTCWPVDRVAGIGGIARLVAWHARRPALHETFVGDLAADLAARIGCRVEVEARAHHVCAFASGDDVPDEVVVRAAAG